MCIHNLKQYGCLWLATGLFAVWAVSPAWAQIERDPNTGYTVVNPDPTDSRIIYVSASTGDDAHDGLSQSSAVASLAAAYDRVRDGYPDQVLLMRGDTWNESFPVWQKSGRWGETPEQRKPMLIGSYGPTAQPRPQIRVDTGSGLTVRADHLAVQSIAFSSSSDTLASSAILSTTSGNGRQNNIFIEDVHVENFNDGMNLQDINNLEVRRSVISNTDRQGIFATRVDQFTVEDNVLDRNGTNSTLDHGVYVVAAENTTVKGNLISRAANLAVNIRSPQGQVTVEDNLIVHARNGIGVGDATGAMVRNNAIVELNPDEPSVGLFITSTDYATITDNLLANETGSGNPSISLRDERDDSPRNIKNLLIQDNTTFQWNRGGLNFFTSVYEDLLIRRNEFQQELEFDDLPSGLISFTARSGFGGPVEPENVTFEDNTYYINKDADQWFRNVDESLSLAEWQALTGATGEARKIDYIDDQRTIAAYMAMIASGGDLETLIELAKENQPGQYDAQVTASTIVRWFQEGFDTAAVQRTWQGSTDIDAPGEITQPDQWSDQALPEPTHDVLLDNDAAARLNSVNSFAVRRMTIGQDGRASYTQAAGQSNIQQWLTLGEQATGEGTIQLNNGIMAARYLQAGHAGSAEITVQNTGYLQVETAHLADQYGSRAKINLSNGGTMIAQILTAGYGDAEIHLDNGTLAVQTDFYAGAYHGKISGSGSVIKDGAGIWSITGIHNDYQGATHVLGGTLAVNNMHGSATGNSTVNVMNNATLMGTGAISGAVNLGSGSTIQPGNVVPGELTLRSDLLINANATYQWMLNDFSTSRPGEDSGIIRMTNTSAMLIADGGELRPVFMQNARMPSFDEDYWASERSWLVIENAGAISADSVSMLVDNQAWSAVGNFATRFWQNSLMLEWSPAAPQGLTQPQAPLSSGLTIVPIRQSNPIDFAAQSASFSETGTITIQNSRVNMATGSPAWILTTIDLDELSNYLEFELEFTSPSDAEGLLQIYLDGALIGYVDERFAPDDPQKYLFALPTEAGPGQYRLSLRLDSFNAQQSQIAIDNITFGFADVIPEPATVSLFSIGALALMRRRWAVRRAALR